MADFEAHIRNAFASKDVSSPDMREAIYQSSRNALQRIVDTNRSMTVEGAMAQRTMLEEAISRIETEITAPPPPPLPEPPQQEEFISEAEKLLVDENDPLYEIQQILLGGKRPVAPQAVEQQPEPVAEPAAEFAGPQAEATLAELDVGYDQVDGINEGDVPALSQEEYESHGTVPAGFTRRRKKQKMGGWVILIIAILAVLGWIGYEIYSGLQDGSLIGLNKDNRGANTVSNELEAPDYITIINPSDLSSLIVAGRGNAELVTQQNRRMIRVMSQRDSENRTQAAEPILLRLKPGVLERISGKTVTVEIFAKTGTSDQAQFSVSCLFANGSECGRKRFVAGVQPQASVFDFQFGVVSNTQADFFITLNTDTTNNATVSGKGDVLDIVYVRLKTSDSQ